tara:strand:- start:8395 stop:10773 length:2379 start_codon:yes stop_codon:yes gene_type:complete
MANSYTEYTASSVTTSTQFVTPSYITGRGATDISVTVGGVTQASSAYTLTGTNITFASGSLPTDGAKIRITRSTSQNARINTYSENTILTSSQLNTDGDQSFMMSQEALDQAASTDFGAQTFYTSGTSTPSSATAGDLFFNTSTGILQVYTGSAFESVNNRGTKQTFAISTSTTTFAPSTPVDDNTLVFLNGVLLVKGAGSAGDYTTSSTQVTLNTAVSSGVVEVVTFPNATNGTFTGTVTAGGLSLGDGQSIYVGANNDLEIVHRNDGSQTTDILETGGGNLRIAGRAIEINNDSGINEYQIVLDGTGTTNKAKLFYGQPSSSSDYKIATTATGIDVKGTVTADSLDFSGNTTGINTSPLEAIKLPENSKLQFSDTFQIAHRTFSNVPYAYISEVGSGGLRLEGASVSIFTNDSSSDGASFDVQRLNASAGATGNVKLYYGNETNYANHKFETTSTGVNVTGTVTADGLTLGDNEAATFNGNLEIKSNGTDSSITETGNGSLTIKGENFVVKNASNQNLIVGLSSLQLFGDGERRMQTVSAGIAVEGTSSQGGQLTLREADYDNAGEHKVTFKPASDNWAGNYEITVPVTGNASMVVADSSGNVNVNGTVTADALDIDGAVDVNTSNGNVDFDIGSGTFTITSTNTGDQLLLTNTNTGSGLDGAPDIVLRNLYTNVSEIVDNNILGSLHFGGNTLNVAGDAISGATENFGRILCLSNDVTDGTHDGILDFKVADNGTIATRMQVKPDGIDVTGTVTPSGGYKSSDGTAGFTGSASASATLTIKDGLIVAVS